MFLAYPFNPFNFVTATIFKVFSNFINCLFTAFFSRNFDMCKALFTAFFSRNFNMCKSISPKNLKRSKLGSLGLHQKVLKLCFLNISSLSFSSSVS